MARREDDPTGTGGEPTGPSRDALYQQVAAYYRQYLGREGSPAEINGWLDSGQTIDAIWKGIRDSDEAKARTQAASAPAAPQPGDRAGTPPPAATPPKAGLGGLGGTSFTAPFPGVFQPPASPTGPPSWWTPPPTFKPPEYKQPPPFVAPTLQDALNEPGYQFAATEGRNALERSAAAKGILNTGGTLKDILAWGDQFAQQQYGNVFDRAKQKYSLDYTSQYADPFAASYKSALDAYNPKLLGWQNQLAATQRGSELDYSRAWDAYLQQYQAYRNQQLDLWGRVKDASTI